MIRNKKYFADLITFLIIAEKLKTEIRHVPLSNESRKESTAEHTWMMSLLSIILLEEITVKIDKLKTLKMIIVHDLVEAINGDIPAFEVSKRKENKYKDELKALKQILKPLPNKKVAGEFLNLWLEFEEEKTVEAKFAKAIDKSEVLIQHNIGGTKQWEQPDFDLNPYYSNNRFDLDPFLRKFKDFIDNWTMQLIEESNTLDRISPDIVSKYRKSKLAK